MSIKVMSHVWEYSKQSGARLLLLLALADHADDDGVCFPGIARLALKTRRTENAVQKILSLLVKSGELEIQYNKGVETSSGRTNIYKIITSQGVEKLIPQGVEISIPLKGKIPQGVEKLIPQGVEKLIPQGVEKLIPKPSDQPSDQPSERAPEILNLFFNHFKEIGQNFETLSTNSILMVLKKYGLSSTIQAYEAAIEADAKNIPAYAAKILRTGGINDKQNKQAHDTSRNHNGKSKTFSQTSNGSDKHPVAENTPGDWSGISLG